MPPKLGRRGGRRTGEGEKGEKRTERATGWGKGGGKGKRGKRGCGMRTGHRDRNGPAGADGSVTSGCGLLPRGAAPPADRRTPQLPGSLACPPLLLGRRRRGPGRRGSQRRLLRARPWMQRLGRRWQRRRQRPDPCGHHRTRRQALAGRALQQPAAAIASFVHSSSPRRSAAAVAGLSRSAPARGAASAARPSPARARARTRGHSQSLWPGGSRAASGKWAGDTSLPQPTQAGSRRNGDAYHADICTRTVTRAILTRALSHSPNIRSHTRSHLYLPDRTTWES